MPNNCSIRPLVQGDLIDLLQWRNHPKVRSYMLNQHQIDINEHNDWFHRASMDETRKLFIVEENQIPIGFVQFSGVCSRGMADWGFYTKPNSPKGSGLKLGYTALEHAFKVLELQKVCGRCIENNLPSISFHKKLGFQIENALPNQQMYERERHKLICFYLLSNEWQPELLVRENKHA